MRATRQLFTSCEPLHIIWLPGDGDHGQVAQQHSIQLVQPVVLLLIRPEVYERGQDQDAQRLEQNALQVARGHVRGDDQEQQTSHKVKRRTPTETLLEAALERVVHAPEVVEIQDRPQTSRKERSEHQRQRERNHHQQNVHDRQDAVTNVPAVEELDASVAEQDDFVRPGQHRGVEDLQGDARDVGVAEDEQRAEGTERSLDAAAVTPIRSRAHDFCEEEHDQ